MVIASAGQMASHNLQAMQRSSPFSYRRSACKPLNRGDSGVFSSGYSSVILLLKAYLPVSFKPLKSSPTMKLDKKSFNEKAAFASTELEVGVNRSEERRVGKEC